MKTLHYFGILVLTIALYSCDSTNPTENKQLIMPLKEGNWWLYEISTFDSIGLLVGRQYDTVHVGPAINVSGEEGHWVAHHYKGFDNDSSIQINRADGLWELKYHPGPWLIYKHPTQKQDTFSIEMTSWPDGDGILEKRFNETVALQEPVTIPLGTFSTIHYRWHYQEVDSLTHQVLSGFSIDHYVAPGIGLIKKITPISWTVGLPDTLIFERRTQELVLKAYGLK